MKMKIRALFSGLVSLILISGSGCGSGDPAMVDRKLRLPTIFLPSEIPVVSGRELLALSMDSQERLFRGRKLLSPDWNLYFRRMIGEEKIQTVLDRANSPRQNPSVMLNVTPVGYPEILLELDASLNFKTVFPVLQACFNAEIRTVAIRVDTTGIGMVGKYPTGFVVGLFSPEAEPQIISCPQLHPCMSVRENGHFALFAHEHTEGRLADLPSALARCFQGRVGRKEFYVLFKENVRVQQIVSILGLVRQSKVDDNFLILRLDGFSDSSDSPLGEFNWSHSPEELRSGKPVRVKRQELEHQLVSRVAPESIRVAGRSVVGYLRVRILVDARGDVRHVTPLSGNPIFDFKAVEAVKRWKYRPLEIDGVRYPMEGDANILFSR